MCNLRPIAFYLPQYHPIPENDEWWGKGFTEWTNVAKARPLFNGHYQPHLPADLGFYDLRVPEVRQAQADLASHYGIHGFCYYHYWFNGKRLLERPFNEVLTSGKPEFPFCLCWANESWRRNWDGKSGEILLEQRHDPEDDLRHIRWLCQVFRDPRYIRVDGKPILLIYRAKIIEHIDEMLETWRAEAMRQGVGELHICRVESVRGERGDCLSLGFDAAVEFQPDWEICSAIETRLKASPSFVDRVKRCFGRKGSSQNNHSPNLLNYRDLIDRSLSKVSPNYVRYPCVTPFWDNTARRGANSIMITDSTPALFREWVASVARQTANGSQTDILFVNAWNEWAEGCHLEPCQKWKHAYLEALKEGLRAGCL